MLKEAWTLAIETLSWMEMRRLSEPLALARTVKQLNVSDQDALRLAHMLVVETVRRQNFIDSFINNAMKPASLGELNLGIQAFLRLYVYQTRIAKNWSNVDVEEAANIAGLGRSILGWRYLRCVEPFFGVLLMQKPDVVFEGVSDEKHVGLQTFHPVWFVKYCLRLFGRRAAKALLEADMQPPSTYVRLNALKAKENEFLERLNEDGVKVEKVEQLKYAYKVMTTKQPLTKTTSFKEGLFYIQDKASCFAAEAANPTMGMTVLDVCAAPGARTTYLAQLMQNRGSIISLDYSSRRMAVWKREVTHMDVEIAEPVIADVRGSWPVKFESDLLVLDPPCTGTGTFGKSPWAKWRLTPHSIETMAEIQWQMLDHCAEHIKLGGVLLYSTCSMTVEENEILIERFLKWHQDFSLSEITPSLGLPGLRGLEKCRRLYPHIHQCNGFFIARLTKE